MTTLDEALARLERGEFDGERRGVRFAKCNGGYLFKIDPDVAPEMLNVWRTTGMAVRDVNEGTGRPELQDRPGNLEPWEGRGAVFLKWNVFTEVP